MDSGRALQARGKARAKAWSPEAAVVFEDLAEARVAGWGQGSVMQTLKSHSRVRGRYPVTGAKPRGLSGG